MPPSYSANTINALTYAIIGAAMEVHRQCGPGLLESAYSRFLCRELALRNIALRAEVGVPVSYKGVHLDCGYRLDILVAELVVIEVKAVEVVLPVHRAQLLTYLRLGGWPLGLLINFNVAVLRDGVERIINGRLQ